MARAARPLGWKTALLLNRRGRTPRGKWRRRRSQGNWRTKGKRCVCGREGAGWERRRGAPPEPPCTEGLVALSCSVFVWEIWKSFLGQFPGGRFVLLKLRRSARTRNVAHRFILQTNKTSTGRRAEFCRVKRCQQDVALRCSQLPRLHFGLSPAEKSA